MTKQKDFKDKGNMKSNSSKLTGWLTGTKDQPVEMEEEEDMVPIRIESDEEDVPQLGAIAQLRTEAEKPKPRGGKRVRYVEENISDDEGFQAEGTPATKKTKAAASGEEEAGIDEKKKMLLNTSYEGFSIYGRILCLVVKRKGAQGRIPGAPSDGMGQQMLESWVSTQAAQEPISVDD